jgi:inner membrane protein
MEPDKTSLLDRFGNWLRTSVIVKLAFIGFAMLLLLIPASMIQSLVGERRQTRDNVVAEVSDKWGSHQYVTGLVLSLPYTVVHKEGVEKRYFHILPDTIELRGTLTPHVRHRSLYEVLLYNAQLAVTGNLTVPDLARHGINPDAVLWAEATVSVGISDLRGVKAPIVITCNGTKYETGPGTAVRGLMGTDGSVSAPINLKPGQPLVFSYDLNLNGSQRLYVSPVGKMTTVQVSSSWASPSFSGHFLPESRTVTAQGFTATWRVLHLNRSIPQAFSTSQFENRDRNYEQADGAPSLNNVAFGVDFLPAIDGYQTTERSTKYGSMLVLLTFLTFFLVEVLGNRHFHPVQYLIVGISLVMFYLLLLSLCEYIPFGWAYLAGCVTIVGLVTYYAVYIFKDTRLTLTLLAVLMASYGFFYILLQLPDYALLIGTLGLLAVLAAVIVVTRKLDWYNLGR